MAVHETLRLHITAERFFFEPVDTGENELLVIDRVTQDISLQANEGQIPASAVTQSVCGIMGIIRLIAGAYLIVITKKEKVGEINGQSIWKVTGTELHSYKRTMLHLTEKQSRDNGVYVSMVESALKTESYYFSCSYDITHTLQRLYNTSPDFLSMPLHERADQRFLWNGHVLRELAQQSELSRYCLPIMHGFIVIKSTTLNNRPIDYILISRRSVYRAGTRFNVRGLDGEGQVANFLETEQIVKHDDCSCSFVQTRGSIPLYWSQRPNLKYMPRPQIRPLNHMDGLKRHFDDQIYNYGDQVVVNLVNQKGFEGQLEKTLAQSVTNAQSDRIKYEYFDFHHECRKMRWDRLSILVNRLEPDRKKFGCFMVLRDGHTASQQDGVFRTNCMDCLDRTNVVQGLLAKVSLEEQLEKLGVIESHQKIDEYHQFKVMFNNIWADNADTISKQYAGTGALKTDFTRTGKRTKMGLLQDGWNSFNRYFKNNFGDGFRQDSIDLILGNYQVEETEGITKTSPLQAERDWKFYAIPVIFIIAMSMCVISILLPDGGTPWADSSENDSLCAIAKALDSNPVDDAQSVKEHDSHSMDVLDTNMSEPNGGSPCADSSGNDSLCAKALDSNPNDDLQCMTELLRTSDLDVLDSQPDENDDSQYMALDSNPDVDARDSQYTNDMEHVSDIDETDDSQCMALDSNPDVDARDSQYTNDMEHVSDSDDSIIYPVSEQWPQLSNTSSLEEGQETVRKSKHVTDDMSDLSDDDVDEDESLRDSKIGVKVCACVHL